MAVKIPGIGAAASPVGSPYLGRPVGFQTITSALSAAVAPTVPVTARYAYFQADTADVKWTDDGTTPTASVGMTITHAQAPWLYAGKLDALQFILVSGSPVLNISYYA